MNLDQMAYRCPAASGIEPVHLEGIADLLWQGKEAVLPLFCRKRKPGEGVLWKITPECEKEPGLL